MKTLLPKLYQPYELSRTYLEKLHHLVSLLSRLYIAKVFFSAGLVKLRDWDTTLFLFEEEYQVPLLPYDIAAYLGTFGELVFPVLLAIGFTSRISALALSIVNVVAVISLSEIAPAAFYLHIIWGILLAHIAIYGGGRFSLDYGIRRYNLKSI